MMNAIRPAHHKDAPHPHRKRSNWCRSCGYEITEDYNGPESECVWCRNGYDRP